MSKIDPDLYSQLSKASLIIFKVRNLLGQLRPPAFLSLKTLLQLLMYGHKQYEISVDYIFKIHKPFTYFTQHNFKVFNILTVFIVLCFTSLHLLTLLLKLDLITCPILVYSYLKLA